MQRLDHIDCKSSFVSTQNEDNLSFLLLLASCLHLLVCVPVLSETAFSDNTNIGIIYRNYALEKVLLRRIFYKWFPLYLIHPQIEWNENKHDFF